MEAVQAQDRDLITSSSDLFTDKLHPGGGETESEEGRGNAEIA